MIDIKRPNKEDYDFNDNIEGVRYAKDMNDYADKLEEQLRLYIVGNSTCKKAQAIEALNNTLLANKQVGTYKGIEQDCIKKLDELINSL